MVSDCRSRGVAVAPQVLAVWLRKYASVEYVEVHHGEELRGRMAAGALAGDRGQAVQAALAGRVEVSREEARLWAAAFG
eukprot:12958614-Alexandrium_andersonii.AAC.1